MRRPAGDLPPGITAVFLAVVHEYAAHGRATVRTVTATAGFRSTSTVHYHLLNLRALGLVTWTDGRSGTLRPTVAIVIPVAA